MAWLWQGNCWSFECIIHYVSLCPCDLRVGSKRHCLSVRPLHYLLLNHWAEFNQTYYSISTCVKGVREQVCSAALHATSDISIEHEDFAMACHRLRNLVIISRSNSSSSNSSSSISSSSIITFSYSSPVFIHVAAASPGFCNLSLSTWQHLYCNKQLTKLHGQSVNSRGWCVRIIIFLLCNSSTSISFHKKFGLLFF